MNWARVLHGLLREPLAHFVVLGAALFALYGWLSRDRAPEMIVVDTRQAAALEDRFESVWGRAPTGAERAGLIEAHVRDEVLYREGMALGLDRTDPVVRRRVGQRMMFLLQTALPPEPSDEELQAWLDSHVEEYREPARYDLQQAVFSAGRGERAGADAAHALGLVRDRDAAWPELGDRTMLPTHVSNVGAPEIASRYGREFLDALDELPVGEWRTVASPYGVHVVRVTARTPAEAPALDGVRSRVERDLGAHMAREREDEAYRLLRERYDVRIDVAPARDPAPAAQ